MKNFDKKELLEAALNPENCDLIVKGKLVNVLTEEIYESSVGIKHGKIVYVENEEIKKQKFN